MYLYLCICVFKVVREASLCRKARVVYMFICICVFVFVYLCIQFGLEASQGGKASVVYLCICVFIIVREP